eukprot:scaffold182160_cov24-Tisochrysis_lutea.AAC.1
MHNERTVHGQDKHGEAQQEVVLQGVHGPDQQVVVLQGVHVVAKGGTAWEKEARAARQPGAHAGRKRPWVRHPERRGERGVVSARAYMRAVLGGGALRWDDIVASVVTYSLPNSGDMHKAQH